MEDEPETSEKKIAASFARMLRLKAGRRFFQNPRVWNIGERSGVMFRIHLQTPWRASICSRTPISNTSSRLAANSLTEIIPYHLRNSRFSAAKAAFKQVLENTFDFVLMVAPQK
jgi:hypothetical protein